MKTSWPDIDPRVHAIGVSKLRGMTSNLLETCKLLLARKYGPMPAVCPVRVVAEVA